MSRKSVLPSSLLGCLSSPSSFAARSAVTRGGFASLRTWQVRRFLCDEMLRDLGRWLRAAGYDTVIAAGGLPDRALAARCAEEDRVLLTKHRHLATAVAGTAPVVLVPGDAIDETARALRIALDIDWQHAPFTRCIVDNRPLKEAPPYLATRVPERSRAVGGPLRVCPECSVFIGRAAMSAECSSGLLPDNNGTGSAAASRPVSGAAKGQRHEWRDEMALASRPPL